MTPFKLLQLPAVALRHVLSTMPLADLFLLTLFFEKFRKFARKLHKTPTEIRIEFNDSDSSYWVYLGTCEPVLKFSGEFQTPEKQLRRIGGQKMWIGFSAPRLTCLHPHLDSLWTEIQQNVLDLFGESPPIDVRLTASQAAIFPKSCEKIRNFYVKIDDNEKPGVLQSADFENFFATHTVTQKATVYAMVEGDVCVFSPFLKIDTLLLLPFEWFTGDHLVKFAGSHLRLYQSVLKTVDLIRLISLWLNGNNQKLKSVIISVGSFEPHVLWREFSGVLMEYDGERRPDRYGKLPIGDFDHDLDCTTAIDMKRPSDGLLASIKITPRKFHFFVWH